MFDFRKVTLAHAEGIAKVHFESWQTTYKDIFPAEMIRSRTLELRIEQWTNWLSNPSSHPSSHHWVATEDEEIVGFVSGGKNADRSLPFDIEVKAIYFFERVQRQGLGRKLLASILKEIVPLYGPRLYIWVAAENFEARHFYTALGGESGPIKEAQFGPVIVPEVAYTWADAQALIRV